MNDANQFGESSTTADKIVDQFTTQLTRSYQSECNYLGSIVRILESQMPPQRLETIDKKITDLAKILTDVKCDSFNQIDIKKSIDATIQTEYSISKEIALLTSLTDQCEVLMTCAERVGSLFATSLSSTRISQDHFTCDMKALKNVKTKYAELSKTYDDLNVQLEEKLKEIEHIPNQQNLITCQKEINRLQKYKSELEIQVNHYLGISQDTESARNELEKLQRQIESVDSQLLECIGLDAWS